MTSEKDQEFGKFEIFFGLPVINSGKNLLNVFFKQLEQTNLIFSYERFNENLYIDNHHIDWRNATKNERQLSKTDSAVAIDGISLCKTKTKRNAKNIKSFYKQDQKVIVNT